MAREARGDGPPLQLGAHGEQDQKGVVVAIAGRDEERTAVASSLRELLSRLGLEMQESASGEPPWSSEARKPAANGVRARIWVDARRSDRVDIGVQVARGSGFDPPVTRVVARGDASEIVVERVAHAAHATLESLLAHPEDAASSSSTSGSPPSAEPAPAGASQDSRPPSRAAGVGFDAMAFATCRGVASGAGPVFGGGASLDVVAAKLAFRPSLWLSAAVEESFDTQGPDVDLETNVSSFRAIPSAELLRLPVFDLDFGAGFGVDLFHTIPREGRRGAVRLGEPTTLGDPLLEAQVLSRIRITQGARLLVGVQLDYDFGTHRYTAVDRFNNSSSVLEPWAVRPAAILGLCFPLAGAAACGSSQ